MSKKRDAVYRKIERALKAGHMVVMRVEQKNAKYKSWSNRVRILKNNKCVYATDSSSGIFITSCFQRKTVKSTIKAMNIFDARYLKIIGFEVIRD